MKLSTITATLESLGMRPSKSLGQNFLHDQNLAEWIVGQSSLEAGDAWVELGPGLGALTEFALKKSARGLALEKDGRLASFLRERFPALEVEHVDATEFDVRDLFARGPVKVLGNLPYYISSQILFAFTYEPSPVHSMVFTLQRELAERLSAQPRTKEYGALTLLIGRRWEVKYLKTLPGSVFSPAPKVESAVVRISPRADAVSVCSGGLFNALVKQGFSQRRKQLRKMLAGRALDWPQIVAGLGISETARAEELALEQWVALTNFVSNGSFSGAAGAETLAQDVHGEIFDVVNFEDQIVGTATRHKVHEQNLLHRAVHIFVFNNRGELFLQKRSRWKDKHPMKWDSSAAGHVNSGNSYDEAAPRELQEELGIDAALTLAGAITACKGTGWEHVRLYKAVHDGPFTLEPAEIETGGFFTLEQISHWVACRQDDFASGFIECFRVFTDSLI